jgi:intracellular sulfur oxidation DsrE/DsrF family protein
MPMLDRRGLLGGLAVAGAAVATVSTRAEERLLKLSDLKKDTEIACLYHCDFGDPKRLNQMAGNLNNHLAVYDFDPFRVKLVVVTHGQGIMQFLKDLDGTPWSEQRLDPALFDRFVALSKYGVEVYLCNITFRNNKIDINKARTEPFIKIVPSGVATVAELQRKGFAYLKVG